MITIIAKIFLVAFFLNLLYELAHSLLYKTCLNITLQKYVPLIIKASFYDGAWIALIYLAVYLPFGNKNIIDNYFQIALFFIISILFAYFWELYSIKNKRWEYSSKMPLIFGVGVTPIFQLFLTGFISLLIVFI